MKFKHNLYFEILIAANLFPVFCIFKYHWPFFSLIWLYWMESFLHIVFDMSKILVSQKKDSPMPANEFIWYKIQKAGKLFFLKTFILLFYLVFIVMFIAAKTDKTQYQILIETIGFQNVTFNYALLGFLVSSYYRYLFYFIGNKAYLKNTPQDLFTPFNYRTIVLHLVIVLGVFANQYFGASASHAINDNGNIIFLLVYIIIKTIAELIVYFIQKKETSSTVTPFI